MKNNITIRSSAAEYLTFITANGESQVEAVYFEENVWLTQKMMGLLYDVESNTITYHLQKAFKDGELEEDSVTRKFRVTESDGKNIIQMMDYGVLTDNGKISAEMAHIHAESEFEKYRKIQDSTYQSDFDRFMELEGKLKN